MGAPLMRFIIIAVANKMRRDPINEAATRVLKPRIRNSPQTNSIQGKTTATKLIDQ
jgi:hypothetical protein